MNITLFEQFWVKIGEILEDLYDSKKAYHTYWNSPSEFFVDNQINLSKEMSVCLLGPIENG